MTPSSPIPAYTYAAVMVRIVDGDTVDLRIDCGFSIFFDARVRLLGINAPEIEGPQRPQGLLAKAYLQSLVPVGTALVITTALDTSDKYGRLLADLWLSDGRNVSAAMIAANQASAWDGHGPKPVPPAA